MPNHPPIPVTALDAVLSAQFMVAWAGEQGDADSPRLGWWHTDLVWEGELNDVLADVLPHTHLWAMFQAIREAARRRDAALRSKAAEADRLLTLFHLGFDTDERLEERLQTLKCSGVAPHDALPELNEIQEGWDQAEFVEWLSTHGETRYTTSPTGRQLQGVSNTATSPERLVKPLLAALIPLADDYPLPHIRTIP